MNKLQLSIGIGDYYHVRPLFDGEVQAEGIELTRVATGVEEIFWRYAKYREWDASEFSFSNYCAIRSRDESAMIAIPVFPSRVFRHSSIYVRKSAGINRPEDLKGRKVGIPEWVQTAGVYARGFLVHQGGVKLADIQWIQAGLNQPGRKEKVEFTPPPGVRITPVPDRSLNEMILSGEIDAIITARAPLAYDQQNPEVVHLFPEFDMAEEEYAKSTGIFPIMHVVVIRGDVYRRSPWIAMNLYKAFEAAKNIAVERLFEFAVSPLPIAWLPTAAQRSGRLFKGEYWPYGIEPNRVTLEAYLQFVFEQGITPRLLAPEEIFAKETQTSFRV